MRALEALQKSIKPLGGNRLAYGVGLVQAPGHCDPRAPAAVAGTWGSTVTVHSVVNKK
jgi:hypothetical protein